MDTLDDEIGRHLRDAAAAGELQRAESYGKPLARDVGWDDTPADLRMPYKILKDAGAVPPDIALFHERAALREAVARCEEPARRNALQVRLCELDASIALRLESLQGLGGR
jgi:hypothetical protein